MNSLLNSENPLDTQTYNRAVELGKHLALQLDAAIRKALNNRMGRTDWVLSEVMPRMQREIFAWDGAVVSGRPTAAGGVAAADHLRRNKVRFQHPVENA